MKNSPLHNISISCSGFEEPEISEMKQKIINMGGKYDQNLKKSTIYLISNKINTDKCLVIFKNLIIRKKIYKL